MKQLFKLATHSLIFCSRLVIFSALVLLHSCAWQDLKSLEGAFKLDPEEGKQRACPVSLSLAVNPQTQEVSLKLEGASAYLAHFKNVAGSEYSNPIRNDDNFSTVEVAKDVMQSNTVSHYVKYVTYFPGLSQSWIFGPVGASQSETPWAIAYSVTADFAQKKILFRDASRICAYSKN